MKIFIAHTISASCGGQIVGVYPNRQLAKQDLQFRTGWRNDDADWGHFIRVGMMGIAFGNVLDLPRSEEESYEHEH